MRRDRPAVESNVGASLVAEPPRDSLPADRAVNLGWAAVSAAFGSLGRFCMALQADFRVRHVSERIDALLGPGARGAILGSPVSELLGEELFGPGGPLREALLAGQMREGWRASLRLAAHGSRLVSVTVAPLQHDALGVCDKEARYIVVIRPAEESSDDAAPTGFGGLIARSAAMLRIIRLIEDLQTSEVTVLLTGESGTGKEVVARALHAHSPRRDGPFVAVNCGALPAELLESELFGHVRGAFTGATRDRAGRFELAARGTLFLDEIGDLPLPLQVKLLRVLQERGFERVGDSHTQRADARIVAATNADLRTAVARGAFREDLFYRLRVVPIELPPLRARKEDIEPIARFLLARVGARSGREVRFSPDALRALLRYDWQGNVRELENAIEYALAVCKGQTILPEDLPSEVTAAPGPQVDSARIRAGLPGVAVGPPAQSPRGEPKALAPPPPGIQAKPEGAGRSEGLIDREQIERALEDHQWRRSKVAEALGVSRTTLWRRMRELGLLR